MLFDESLATARQTFADQFGMLGSRLAYRRYQRGPAIPISEAERDAAIEAFVRKARWLSWTMLAGAIFMTGLSLAVALLISETWSFLVLGFGVAVLVGALFVGFRRAWVSSTGTFNGRTPIARELDHDEARRAMLSKMSWGQLGIGAGVTCVVVGGQALTHDLFHGWYRLWLVGGAAFLMAFAFRAWQKWRWQS